MQKKHLFSLLALLALVALIAKTGRILNLYYNPTTIVTAKQQESLPQAAQYHDITIEQREVEKAIRKQLDADATLDFPANLTTDDLLYLAEVYSQMSAKDVARILENMDNRQIVFLLTSMNSEQASKIMIQMNLQKIREISELMFATLAAKQ